MDHNKGTPPSSTNQNDKNLPNSGNHDDILVAATVIPDAHSDNHHIPIAYATTVVSNDSELMSAVDTTTTTAAAAAMNWIEKNANNTYEDETKHSINDTKMNPYENTSNMMVHTNPTTTTTIPSSSPYETITSYNPNIERQIAKEATRRGCQLSQEEIQKIQQVNACTVPTIREQEQRNTQIANHHATYQNYQEEHGYKQTSNTLYDDNVDTSKKTTTTTSLKTGDEFFMGTYGKAYETSNYTTKDYETNEYQTTDYKSVYDP